MLLRTASIKSTGTYQESESGASKPPDSDDFVRVLDTSTIDVLNNHDFNGRQSSTPKPNYNAFKFRPEK